MRVRLCSMWFFLWCVEYIDLWDFFYDVWSCELDLVLVGGEDIDLSSEYVL